MLRSYLTWKLPQEIFAAVQPELQPMEQRVITDIYQLGLDAEKTPPQHIPYDPWGRRIDHIETSSAWEKLKVKPTSISASNAF